MGTGGRYPRSGNTDEALTTSAVDVRELLGSAIRAKRTFWLRHLWCYNSHATDDGVLTLWDQDEAAATAANEQMAIPVPHGVLTVIDFPAPGIQFFTNICAAVSAGTVAIYQAGCSGYEEGST